MHVNDKELQKLVDKIGYNGCKNCEYQIAPLRMCNWGENGGDGQLHFICPKWNKRKVVQNDNV